MRNAKEVEELAKQIYKSLEEQRSAQSKIPVKHTAEKKIEDKKSLVINRESVEPDSIEKNEEDKKKLVVKKKNIEGRKGLSDERKNRLPKRITYC